MGKKNETTTPAVAAESLTLSPKLQAVLESLSAEERADILAMEPEAQVDALEMIASLENSENVATDVEFVAAKPERDDILILTAGGPGLRAGKKIRAFLMGTVHVFAKEMKENWKEYKGRTQTFFYNSYFKFKDINGKEFGIWSSPTLRILEKIPTHASTPSLVAQNPMVEIKYVGLVEGKEVLKQVYGIELTKGNKAHVFQVNVASGVRYNAYVKGCVNSLNSPFPIESDETAGTVSREEATRANYEKLMALQNGGDAISGLLAQ
jgi:hypothetical protein